MPNIAAKTLNKNSDRINNSSVLTSPLLNKLKTFGEKVNKFGFGFSVCDNNGELLLLCESRNCKTEPDRIQKICRTFLDKLRSQANQINENGVLKTGQNEQYLAAGINLPGQIQAVAVIELLKQKVPENLKLKEYCCRHNIKCDEISKIITNENRHTEYLTDMLSSFIQSLHNDTESERQIEMVSGELAQTYEELVLLHKLSTNMKVTEADANYLQMACDSLTDIVNVGGIAVLLDKNIDDEKKLVLAAGSGLIDIDDRMAAILHNRLQEQIDKGQEAMLDSEVDSPFTYNWPKNISNIIAVPLFTKERKNATNYNSMIGLMVAVNRIGKQDFDSTDVKLFNSVANGCAVFIENGRLFTDLKELFIGSLKALTSSIDAKDQYTRGHSERVAFISRWIGERLAENQHVQQEQIHKMYLAGLLHDIGKVGINEAVLRKKGKLTKEEINHIRTHPSIGAAILQGIKQMREIVPGVLYHHERIDGKGYPNGIKGNQIPLLGKIVGLADGFDAMTSKRVYRDALTVEQALQEISNCLGTQFDQEIGTLFINSDIYQLWDVIQDGSDLMGNYGQNKFSKYGTVAVGTLIR